MTYQCKYVLKQIRKLSSNSDMALRFNSDGLIRPFSADAPFADCSKYKKEIISIMQLLEKECYITLSGTTIRLTQQGIHIYQNAFQRIFKILYDKWIPFIALLVSILSLMKSYGMGLDDIFTWCMQLLAMQ